MTCWEGLLTNENQVAMFVLEPNQGQTVTKRTNIFQPEYQIVKIVTGEQTSVHAWRGTVVAFRATILSGISELILDDRLLEARRLHMSY